jgi:hypothetical protein
MQWLNGRKMAKSFNRMKTGLYTQDDYVFWGWGEASDRALRERTPWSESRWRYITTRGTERIWGLGWTTESLYCPHQPVGWRGSVCTYASAILHVTLAAVIAYYFQTGDALDIRKLAEKYRRTLVTNSALNCLWFNTSIPVLRVWRSYHCIVILAPCHR